MGGSDHMNIVPLQPTSVIQANPQIAKPLLQQAQKIAEVAAALGRWEEMEQAIDFIIECQREIVGWWDDHVHHGGDRRSSSQGTGNLKIADAQKVIGLSD